MLRNSRTRKADQPELFQHQACDWLALTSGNPVGARPAFRALLGCAKSPPLTLDRNLFNILPNYTRHRVIKKKGSMCELPHSLSVRSCIPGSNVLASEGRRAIALHV